MCTYSFHTPWMYVVFSCSHWRSTSISMIPKSNRRCTLLQANSQYFFAISRSSVKYSGRASLEKSAGGLLRTNRQAQPVVTLAQFKRANRAPLYRTSASERTSLSCTEFTTYGIKTPVRGCGFSSRDGSNGPGGGGGQSGSRIWDP
jgi:hypothetical protein